MNREQRRRAEREQRRRQRTVSRTNPQLVRSVPSETGPPSRGQLDTTSRAAGADQPAEMDTGNREISERAPAEPTRSRPAVVTASSLATSTTGCGVLEEAEPQALGLTYTFDAPDEGPPFVQNIGFTGRRSEQAGEPDPRHGFAVVEAVRVLPGSGRITVTKRVENIAAGEWAVSVGPVLEPDATAPPDRPVPAVAESSGRTGFAPVIRVRAPGTRLGAWPGLVATGAVVALTLQALLSVWTGLPALPVLLVSLVACVIGLVGARLYYMAEHPRQRRGLMNTAGGVCIQGFVLAAVGAVVVGALLLRLPVGRLLDVTTPGLMFGMAIGRVGCFFGGCCAGRPTASRWGLWSSDRRLGVRRIPTQLFESATALVIGVLALLTMVLTAIAPEGSVFVAGIAAYTFGRQLLFPLRDLPRHTAQGRMVTMVASGLITVGALVAIVLV